MSTSTSDRPPVPDNPVFVSFYHPKIKKIFLNLPQNNLLPEVPATFGVHHETALTACFIIAYNQPGFLSTSTNRNDINARVSLEQHRFLTADRYYYHLLTPPAEPNYPICTEFASWSFPHDHFSQLQSWARATEIDDKRLVLVSSDVSSWIRHRDPNCRVTGWFDNTSIAHIVPVDATEWLRDNNMMAYTAMPNEALAHQDTRNLFALRWDIHTFQFDSGNLVMVPIDGEMVTHFIGGSRESANLYHNQPFDTSNLSHEFLYARFAWAVIKHAHVLYLLMPLAARRTFNLKTGDTDTEEDDGDGGGPSDPQQQSDDIKGKGTKRKGPTTRQGTKRQKSGGPGFRDPVHEALELEEDIAIAKKAAPFFLEPEGIAHPYAYENMMWYPGHGIVERKKLEYINAHPNIRATSGLCAASDTDSESTTRADSDLLSQ